MTQVLIQLPSPRTKKLLGMKQQSQVWLRVLPQEKSTFLLYIQILSPQYLECDLGRRTFADII